MLCSCCDVSVETRCDWSLVSSDWGEFLVMVEVGSGGCVAANVVLVVVVGCEAVVANERLCEEESTLTVLGHNSRPTRLFRVTRARDVIAALTECI